MAFLEALGWPGGIKPSGQDPTQGVDVEVSHQAQAENHPLVSPEQHQRTKVVLNEGSSENSSGKGRSGTGKEHQLTRVLLRPISEGQTEWRLASHNRFVQAEQSDCQLFVQDGIREVHSVSVSERRVGVQNRSDGCLFSHSNQQEIQEISEVCNKRGSLPVQGATVWSFDSAPSVYVGDDRTGEDSQNTQSHNTDVSRRLASKSRQPSGGKTTNQRHPYSLCRPGVTHQCPEVSSDRDSAVRVCGCVVQPSSGQSLSTREKSREDSELHRQSNQSETVSSVPLVDLDRTSGISIRSSPSGQTPHQTNPVVSGRTMETSHRLQVRSDHIESGSDANSTVVETASELNSGSSSGRVQDSGTSIYRCINPGLGCSSGRGGGVRNLDRTRDTSSYKCARDESCQTSPERVCRTTQTQEHHGCHGQHHCSCLHQQSGGDALLVTATGNSRGVPNNNQSGKSAEGSAHPGKTKRHSRQVIQGESDSAHRMVASSISIRQSVDEVGETSCGFVRYTSQSQATIVREPGTGRLRVCRGRPGDGLEQPVRLCLSTNSTGTESGEQNQDNSMQNSASSSIQTRTTMVSRSTKTSNRTSSRTTTQRKSTEATSKTSVPSVPSQSKVTRLDAIRKAIMNQGYSEQVALKVSNCITKDSQKVYETKWNYFMEWCEQSDISPYHASTQQVAEFLLKLFEDGLAVNTIKGYRSALSKPLKLHNDINISEDIIISDLIASFEHERPPGKNVFPKWNLVLVLEALIKQPFEPIHLSSLKMLTFKTVFLIALASGARCGEIHALDVKQIIHEGKWQKVTLKPNPVFLAKNFDYSTGKRNFEGFTIEGLKHRLGEGLEDDAKLCPIRALRFYLDRTSKSRGENKQLFLSIQENRKNKAVGKNAITSWIKQTVKMAYQSCSSDITKKLKINAHEVRAIAHSTAFYGNISMSDLLQSARWAQQTTFTSYYLRDVSVDLDGIHRMGPVLVAQSTI